MKPSPNFKVEYASPSPQEALRTYFIFWVLNGKLSIRGIHHEGQKMYSLTLQVCPSLWLLLLMVGTKLHYGARGCIISGNLIVCVWRQTITRRSNHVLNLQFIFFLFFLLFFLLFLNAYYACTPYFLP